VSSSSRSVKRVYDCSRTFKMLDRPCSETANVWKRPLVRNCVAADVNARKFSASVMFEEKAKS
jgi:hypothetical protein